MRSRGCIISLDPARNGEILVGAHLQFPCPGTRALAAVASACNTAVVLYPLIRRALFALDPEIAHALALRAAQLRRYITPRQGLAIDTTPFPLLGLQFPNRIGLAAGFDKNACFIDALGELGFGFIEVGTVTPGPQSGQLRPRLFRLPDQYALINRMGFPSDGAAAVAQRLARRTYRGICGINIGKNAATPLAHAVDDYVACFKILAPHADYAVINVSSPNTDGLRSLQEAAHLKAILEAVQAQQRTPHLAGKYVPLLVKVAPDLDDPELTAFAHTLLGAAVDGVIATNTTLERASLASPLAHERGGLSGKPLRERSLRVIRRLRELLGPAFPIIGAGGIFCGGDAIAALQAGAQLVQVYTGLVYRGPGLIREIRKELAAFERAGGSMLIGPTTF